MFTITYEGYLLLLAETRQRVKAIEDKPTRWRDTDEIVELRWLRKEVKRLRRICEQHPDAPKQSDFFDLCPGTPPPFLA